MKIQKKNTKNVELSYIKWVILHPIIHMKVSMYNGGFTNWCRNVGENTQNIFSERIWKRKTPAFFDTNIRTYRAKHRNFPQ